MVKTRLPHIPLSGQYAIAVPAYAETFFINWEVPLYSGLRSRAILTRLRSRAKFMAPVPDGPKKAGSATLPLIKLNF